MQVTATKEEGLSREFKVVVPADAINDKMDAKLKEVAGSVNLPGFRPGKAPVSLLKKRFGASLMGEILEGTVNESSAQVLTDRGIKPAGQPKIEIDSFDDGADLEYTMNVDILPEIVPMDFSTLELERLVAEVPEDDVQESLDQMANMNKTLTPIKGKRKSKAGDTLKFDFVGKIGDEAFEGGSAEDYLLELGSNSFIPGFEDQLIGSKAGEELDVTVTFPENYGAEHLAGKEAVFSCKVKEIQEGSPAEIDDELAKKMGAEDLEDLKAKIVEAKGGEYKQVSRMRLKRDLLDKLSDAHDFELPPGLLEGEYEAVKSGMEKSEEDEDAPADDMTDEEKEADYRRLAERRVRLGLLLAEVGQANNLQVTEEEVNRALMAEARRYPGQEQQVVEFFKQNPQMLQQFTGPLFEDKVVDFILEMAKVTDKTVSLEELTADPDEADAKPAPKKKAAPKKKSAPKKKPAAKKAEEAPAEEAEPEEGA
ncbi:MAG: trigger factor [Magnetovibrionaceae bacterium]